MKIIINEKDNVSIDTVTFHKYALCDIYKGEYVIKYGYPIGKATRNIKAGEQIHTHNLASYISEKEEYIYSKTDEGITYSESLRTFPAYIRKNGDIGIRNDIWIIPTVGCVNGIATELARITGAKALTHPYGCSQLGDDLVKTQKTLANLILHPNAGGVLVLGLGCENNSVESLKKYLVGYDDERVKFLICQNSKDEIDEGIRIINFLKDKANNDIKEETPISNLRIGLKCGGSDALSGITANPLIGDFTDRIISFGGSCVLTEVPEMFGAERILMNRCKNEDVFNKLVSMINGFKSYFTSHGQPINENPSPGNKEGGITTIEEKSLGCILKAGKAEVNDVIDYGERVKEKGLILLNGPGNDIVSMTNLLQASCHLILFSTGRGTPLGSFIPTIKISSNRTLADAKPSWIDFDASSILEGAVLKDEFFEYVISVASGEKTKNEIHSNNEISIFKDGVIL